MACGWKTILKNCRPILLQDKEKDIRFVYFGRAAEAPNVVSGVVGFSKFMSQSYARKCMACSKCEDNMISEDDNGDGSDNIFDDDNVYQFQCVGGDNGNDNRYTDYFDFLDCVILPPEVVMSDDF